MAEPFTDLITGRSLEPWAEKAMQRSHDYREALAQALFEAVYGMRLRMWSDETRDYWFARADEALATLEEKGG